MHCISEGSNHQFEWTALLLFPVIMNLFAYSQYLIQGWHDAYEAHSPNTQTFQIKTRRRLVFCEIRGCMLKFLLLDSTEPFFI